jgi:hypothetical protein
MRAIEIEPSEGRFLPRAGRSRTGSVCCPSSQLQLELELELGSTTDTVLSLPQWFLSFSFFGSFDALVVRGRPTTSMDFWHSAVAIAYAPWPLGRLSSRRTQADLYIYTRLLSPFELETADECLMCWPTLAPYEIAFSPVHLVQLVASRACRHPAHHLHTRTHARTPPSHLVSDTCLRTDVVCHPILGRATRPSE